MPCTGPSTSGASLAGFAPVKADVDRQRMKDAESQQPRTVTIRFQGVGPLTRSTVGADAVDPSEEAVGDALHWIWSWRLQVDRLRESFETEWGGGVGIERRRASSRLSFDEHIIAVTGWNVARAVKRVETLFPAIRLSEEQTETLRLLRNLYEHWDEQRPAFRAPTIPKEKSATAFAEKFPEGRPWTIVFAESDWLLGGVLAINALTRALAHFETILLEIEGKPAARSDEAV